MRKARTLAPRLRAWRRVRGHLDMLDSLHQALGVFEPGGAVLFRNQALGRLFRHEAKSSIVATAMEELAREVSRPGARPVRTSVTTAQCSYTLWASSLRPNVFGTGRVLIEVDRGAGVLPPCEDVQNRFDLTPREAEVALLLAEGLENRCIAERLSISPHTARHHTEAVMKRLGISSRAAVTVALLRQL